MVADEIHMPVITHVHVLFVFEEACNLIGTNMCAPAHCEAAPFLLAFAPVLLCAIGGKEVCALSHSQNHRLA